MTTLAEKLIERFPCGPGVIGYDANGMLWSLYDADEGYRPILEAMGDIKNPTQIAVAFEKAIQGTLATPFEQWGNVAGIIVHQDRVRAELDLDESHEEEVSLSDFEPMIRAWRHAWSGAQDQIKQSA